jgi:hypothetical protein
MFQEVPAEERRKLLLDNAVRIFRFTPDEQGTQHSIQSLEDEETGC